MIMRLETQRLIEFNKPNQSTMPSSNENRRTLKEGYTNHTTLHHTNHFSTTTK